MFGPWAQSVCVLGPWALGPKCVRAWALGLGPYLHFEKLLGVFCNWVACFNPFCDVLEPSFELLTHPLENFCVKTVRSITASLHEYTIHAFHDLICLESVCCYPRSIHRILKNFAVRLDVIQILCCKWAFIMQFLQSQLVSSFRGGPLQGPSRLYGKSLI